MNIKFSPDFAERKYTPSYELDGDQLHVTIEWNKGPHSHTYDLSAIADREPDEEGELPPIEHGDLPKPALRDCKRVDGEYHLTLWLPHGPHACEACRFPEPVTMENDGVIGLPGKAGWREACSYK